MIRNWPLLTNSHLNIYAAICSISENLKFMQCRIDHNAKFHTFIVKCTLFICYSFMQAEENNDSDNDLIDTHCNTSYTFTIKLSLIVKQLKF